MLFLFLLRSIYYRIQCLPLLPAEHILGAYLSLRTETISIDKNGFQLFFEYYHRQWIVNADNDNADNELSRDQQ